MFKKFGFGGGDKKEVVKAPAPIDNSLKYEKSLHDIKMQIDKLDE